MAALRVACLLAIAGPLLGQPRTTKLVSLDVVAVDGRGRRVADLRAEEIRVTDNGKRQEIAYFRRGQDATPPQTALAGARSNHGHGTFPHATAVLFDQRNTRLELTGREWGQVVRALARAEEAHDVYLYVLLKNGTLYPVRGMPESWVDAAPANGPWTRELLPQFDDMRREYRARPFLDKPAPPNTPGHASVLKDLAAAGQLATQSALQELAARLAGIPGAGGIVWIGAHRDGASVRPVKDPTGRIRRTTGEPVRAVPLYYVGASAIGTEQRANTPAMGPTIEAAIATALAEAQRAYRIGYFPPDSNWDGRRHDVRVESTRPGTSIRGNLEYTAVRPVDVADDLRQMTPDLAAVGPFDASTIRFSVLPRAGHGLELRVNAADVVFERYGGQYAASLAALGIVYRQNGEQETPRDPVRVNLRLTAAERDAAARDGIAIELPEAGKAGDRLRIVVLDRATQSFGTLTIPCGVSN